jgi:hypothetical protein
MDHLQLLDRIIKSNTTDQIEKVMNDIIDEYGDRIHYVPIGNRENNSGTIELGTDPGKAIVERLTNAIDAVLELEYSKHRGSPPCDTPKAAAEAWLGVPGKGLYMLNPGQRRELSKSVVLKIEEGDDKSDDNVTIIDRGIGITCDLMSSTILSLSEGNKVQKHYLMGLYGQGGSTAFAFCKYSLICSRINFPDPKNKKVCFTIVFYEDLPPEKFKLGRYVYLTLDDKLFEAEMKRDTDIATIVKHYGYDLAMYRSKLGPSSIYGLLQRALFDPVIPIFLDDQIRKYRRVIKGARNALNGAIDDEIEDRGPNIRHNLPLYNISLGEYGTIGLEYWVLEENLKEKKYEPTKAFVDNKRPIIFTLNGQTHAEFPVTLVRTDAQLPFLRNRIIIHVDCDNLSASAKRKLFSSSREDIKKSAISMRIVEEIIKCLKSDDELKMINEEARNFTLKNQEVDTEDIIRKEVAKLLRFQDYSTLLSSGSQLSKSGGIENVVMTPPSHPGGTHKFSKKIELHDPPTYIRILARSPVEFYPDQRRYIRLETDAPSFYHDSENIRDSKINIIINGKDLVLAGTTPLKEGRMRLIVDCKEDSVVGSHGELSVELSCFGSMTLIDRFSYTIVTRPLIKPSINRVSVPRLNFVPVEGQEDATWSVLQWPEDPNKIASSSDLEGDLLTIYYSKIFPPYYDRQNRFLLENPASVSTFNSQYKTLLALHSFLLEHEKSNSSDVEDLEKTEREERCRLATIASVNAERISKTKLLMADIEATDN